MTDFVRVRLENESEATLPREFAEAKKLTILEDKPAVDARGEALNAKHKVNLTPTGKYAGVKADVLAEDAATRGLTVEGTGKDGNVVKDDYIAALEAHDASLGADNT